MEDGLVRVRLGKGEHEGKLKLAVLYCFVLLVLHMVKEGETCRQREISHAGKGQPPKRKHYNSLGY